MQTQHPLLKQIMRFFNGREVVLPKPAPGKKQFILCPISSGIDSTAVAVVMHLLFPELPITHVHNDTGIEVDGTSEAIDRIERFTGKKVIRIKPPMDLLDYIKANGNYLPSQRQRFCTNVAKIMPYKMLIKALEAKHPDCEFISLVGIRADEPSRTGVAWTEGNITSVFPLKMLGLDKAAVNRIVAETVTIPHYYAARSRSGCHTCFFMRRSEIIEMIKREVEGMAKASATECLPAEYEARLKLKPSSVSARTGISRNWLRMAVPTELGGEKLQWDNERGVVRHNRGQADLFSAGNKTFFVAVEHHFENELGSNAVHYQRVITYSGSLGGLKTALKHHWLHRLNTRDLFQAGSEEALRDSIKIGIYVIDIFNGDDELPEAPAGVYTWQSDRQPIELIKKTSYMLEQTLLEEGLFQDAQAGDKWSQRHVSKLGERTGEVLHGSIFTPLHLSDLVTDIDITDAPLMCNACSR